MISTVLTFLLVEVKTKVRLENTILYNFKLRMLVQKKTFKGVDFPWRLDTSKKWIIN